jgi:hypothetical protein
MQCEMPIVLPQVVQCEMHNYRIYMYMTTISSSSRSPRSISSSNPSPFFYLGPLAHKVLVEVFDLAHIILYSGTKCRYSNMVSTFLLPESRSRHCTNSRSIYQSVPVRCDKLDKTRRRGDIPSKSNVHMTSGFLPLFSASLIAFSGISIFGNKYIAPSAGTHDIPGRELNRSLMYKERDLRLDKVVEVWDCQRGYDGSPSFGGETSRSTPT